MWGAITLWESHTWSELLTLHPGGGKNAEGVGVRGYDDRLFCVALRDGVLIGGGSNTAWVWRAGPIDRRPADGDWRAIRALLDRLARGLDGQSGAFRGIELRSWEVYYGLGDVGAFALLGLVHLQRSRVDTYQAIRKDAWAKFGKGVVSPELAKLTIAHTWDEVDGRLRDNFRAALERHDPSVRAAMYYRDGQFEEAIKELAEENPPVATWSKCILAMALHRTGDADAARAELDKAVAASSDARITGIEILDDLLLRTLLAEAHLVCGG
jgi:hypothetical protein